MPPKKKSAAQKATEANETVNVEAPASKKLRTEAEAEDVAQKITTVKDEGKSSSRGAAITEEDILKGTTPFVRKTSDKDFDPASMIRIVSWNVAGLRSILKKDSNELQKLFDETKPDVVCLQETKLSSIEEAKTIGVIDGYTFVDSISTAKKGYSGTRTYVRDGAFRSAVNIPGFDVLSKVPKEDDEGRVLTTDVTTADGALSIALLNSYVPNSGMTLDRLDYRTQTYDPMIRKLLVDLHQRKSKEGYVVWTGDLNVAERDYDRYFATNFKAMQKVPGFTPEERASFRQTLQETGMVDGFRHVYPNAAKAYTFWSAKFQSKAKGNGWRLDYFVLSQKLAAKIVDCFMLPEYVASDHCPLVLWLKK